jgi:hypothetical protein
VRLGAARSYSERPILSLRFNDHNDGRLMKASEPVDDPDSLASIIPLRPKRSAMALHPSAGLPEPVPSGTTGFIGPLPHSTPMQLSLFEISPNP